MSFTQQDIEKIADLSRIGVTPEQTQELSKNLTEILDMVAKMNSADTEDIMPLAHPFDATQPLRTDQITETDQRELFQSLAPQVQSGLYIVPKVIDAE
jgi:aspartyl-tRNA(Asn)/glutamyl-tRNA(Gln) amidotransferase subunit C